MINIISLLLIKELENISSINNIFLISITAKIFPEEIAGESYQLWSSLLNLLFSNDISSKNVFDFYSNIEDIPVQNKVTLLISYLYLKYPLNSFLRPLLSYK